MFMWWPRITAALAALWDVMTEVVSRVCLFPVDCVFCIYDLFAVNLRKMGMFGSDCRDQRGGCAPPRRYTNKWLFKFFVCQDCVSVNGLPVWDCGALDEERTCVVRGLLALAVILLGMAALSVVLIGSWLPSQQEAGGVNDTREVKRWVVRGDQAFEDEDYNEAIGFYRRALGADSSPCRVNYRAGLCVEKQVGIEAALAYYQRAVHGADPIPQGAVRLATHYYDRGELHQAGVWAERGLDIGSDDARLHAILAENYLAGNKASLSDQHLKQAQELDAEDPIVRMARARVLLSRGDPEGAETLLAAVGRHAHPTSSLCRALILCEKGSPAEACGILERQVTQFPSSLRLRIHLVNMLFVTGSREEALGQLRQLTGDFSLTDDQKLALSRILREHGEPDRALDFALNVIENEGEGTFVPASILAARIYSRAGLFLRAERQATRVLDKNPQHAGALALQGEIALDRGNLREARRLFERALQYKPDMPDVLYQIGQICVTQGLRGEAVNRFAEACELAPERGSYRYAYGSALLAVGREEEAVEQLERATQLLEDAHMAWTQLGEVSGINGKPDRAMSCYRRAILENPFRAVLASRRMAQMLMRKGEQLPLALALAYSAHVTGENADGAHADLLPGGELPPRDYRRETNPASSGQPPGNWENESLSEVVERLAGVEGAILRKMSEGPPREKDDLFVVHLLEVLLRRDPAERENR